MTYSKTKINWVGLARPPTQGGNPPTTPHHAERSPLPLLTIAANHPTATPSMPRAHLPQTPGG